MDTLNKYLLEEWVVDGKMNSWTISLYIIQHFLSCFIVTLQASWLECECLQTETHSTLPLCLWHSTAITHYENVGQKQEWPMHFPNMLCTPPSALYCISLLNQLNQSLLQGLVHKLCSIYANRKTEEKKKGTCHSSGEHTGGKFQIWGPKAKMLESVSLPLAIQRSQKNLRSSVDGPFHLQA